MSCKNLIWHSEIKFGLILTLFEITVNKRFRPIAGIRFTLDVIIQRIIFDSMMVRQKSYLFLT